MASKIDIKIVPKTEIHGKGLQLSVSLWSHNRPGLKADSSVFISTKDPDSKMYISAQAAGGALAEYLNDNYGDRHDPSECAKVAGEALHKMLSDYNQTGRLQEHTLSS